jgi:hypothetical protein
MAKALPFCIWHPRAEVGALLFYLFEFIAQNGLSKLPSVGDRAFLFYTPLPQTIP